MTKDIELLNDYDLRFEQGDFASNQSGDQHAALILFSRPGEWKQNPWLGADYLRFLNDDEGAESIIARLQQQLNLDGATVEEIIFDGNDLLSVKGNYDD